MAANPRPRRQQDDAAGYSYLSGLGNTFSSEAVPGSLPRAQNSPLVCPIGLYDEQLSGTSFTTPRARNLRTWFYRIKPSVTHEPPHWGVRPHHHRRHAHAAALEASRGAPDAASRLHRRPLHRLRRRYAANKSMDGCAICNADGDFLIVPQQGKLLITTECGKRLVSPGEIVVIPEGFRFAVDLPDGPSRGYVSEIFGTHFQLPDLGPIVLTAPNDKPGVALLDFVIFPPRWLVAENTFRPPNYHRNCMSEFMGLIYGIYEAKADGFLPGGASLHSCMIPHGQYTVVGLEFYQRYTVFIKTSIRASNVIGSSSNLIMDVASAAQKFGINYGQIANNLPDPTQVAGLLRTLNVNKVKLYDADPKVLTSFANTGVEFIIAVGNENLQSMANNPGAARQWVAQHVQPFLVATRITCITVGNEVFSSDETGMTTGP